MRVRVCACLYVCSSTMNHVSFPVDSSPFVGADNSFVLVVRLMVDT